MTVDCIAHRGFAGTNPENTLAAVREAATTGADLVEIDVRRCGSGELVLCHDADLDRVSDGSGPVADHSLAELRALDVLGTGSGVPTLAEAFRVADDTGTRLNVELKERDTAVDALAVADEFGSDPLVSAFDPAILEAARDARPGGDDADTAFLFADSPDESVERARKLGCVAVHPHVDLCTPGFVERAHEAGLAINAWTVRDGETAKQLHGAGVDGLISDAPAYCRRGSAGA